MLRVVGRLHQENLYINDSEYPFRVLFGEELIPIRGLRIKSYSEEIGSESNTLYLSLLEKLKFDKGRIKWILGDYEFPLRFFFAIGHAERISLPDCDLSLYDSMECCGVKFNGTGTFTAYLESEMSWEEVEALKESKEVEPVNLESIWNDKELLKKNLLLLYRRPLLKEAYKSFSNFSDNEDRWVSYGGYLYNLDDSKKDIHIRSSGVRFYSDAQRGIKPKPAKVLVFNKFKTKEEYDFVSELMEVEDTTLLITNYGPMVMTSRF